MISDQVTTVQSTTHTFTTPAPDTSNIVAEVESGMVTITYGGSSLMVPTAALPVLGTLITTVSAAFPVVTPVP